MDLETASKIHGEIETNGYAASLFVVDGEHRVTVYLLTELLTITNPEEYEGHWIYKHKSFLPGGVKLAQPGPNLAIFDEDA